MSAPSPASDRQTRIRQVTKRLRQELAEQQAALQEWSNQSGIDWKVAIQELVGVMAIATGLTLSPANPGTQPPAQVEAQTFSSVLPTATTLLGQVMSSPLATSEPVPLAGQSGEIYEADPLETAITAEEHQAIMDKLVTAVTGPVGHLDTEAELYLEQQLSDMLKFEVSAELDENRLNHSIGIIGGEQHLKRFPTDTLDQHDAFLEAGIAPNRGAFGWFTEGGQLTDKAIQREKYYLAVQTMYLPNWQTEHPRLKEWYKFRKMIVINPHDQLAVVAVVGDAGPAQWVKKQFGGSPEVIREAKLWSKASRGRVMVLFVDDPEDKIPLGPIDMSFEALYQHSPSTVAGETGL